MGRTLLVHATSLFVRGFLGAPTDRRSDDGKPTNALFALTRALQRALAFKQPDRAVAILDAEPEVARWPALLRAQHESLGPLLAAHGMRVIATADAARVVASYAHASLDGGDDVVVVSSDKRMAQLVSDRLWWYDAFKDVRYTPELVRKRFEVRPEHVAGWLALVGDDDTLPGVKGIGKKGATDLVSTFGSIDEALGQAETIEGRTGKALRASLDAAREQIASARLDRHRPLPVPLGELVYTAPDVASLNALYRDHGFFSLLAKDEHHDAREVVRCDTPAAVRQVLAALTDEPVALQALIEEPSPVRGALVGLAIAQAETAAYFPIAGVGPHLESLDELAAWLADPARPKIGHDVKAAVVALARRGIPVEGIVGDSACASHLADPSGMAPHDLPLVAKRRLRRAIDEDTAILGVGQKRKSWADLNVDEAGAHVAEHASVAEALWQAFEPTVPAALLDEYLDLSRTLVRMELTGLACDRVDLARAGEDFEATEADLERQIYALAGHDFNLGSTKQLGTVLYEELGLPIMKRTKTGWSTATDALERIEKAHPIVALVIRSRRLRRLRESWVTALSAAIDADGRVRSTFHPARSFSGRLVNSQPDLGRVPGRTPEMKRIRHAFVAPPDSTLLSVDYKQLGLYVLAHLTGDPALVEPLTRGDDMHVLTAMAVLELNADEVGPDQRQTGKVVNFATFAGQGASALALQLGVSAKEAKELVARFDKRYAVVRAFQDEQLVHAKEHGFVETIAGRRWSIGGLASADTQELAYAERLARRATHEGSVADVTRRGLLLADRALRAAGLRAVPLLQVHDEVLFEVPDDELTAAARVAADAMRGAFDLVVPLSVTCKAGPNWAELTPFDPSV